MNKEAPIELFMPPNMLKARVGGRFVGIDMAAIKRAESAVAELAPEFADWISKDVARLGAAYLDYRKRANPQSRANLEQAAEDLRVEALNFGFPLIARVATSLCTLVGGHENPVPSTLVEAHVSAIRVIGRQKNMHDDSDPTANILAAELERQVEQCLLKLGVADQS